MRRNLLVFSALVFGLLVAGESVVAHHRFFGVLDLKTPITFEGVITDFEWVNPHISINVDVKDQSGKVTNWRFEGANPAALQMRGWVRTLLKKGDKIKVQGYRAKDGSFVAGAASVTFPDGRTLDAASDGVPPHNVKPRK